MSDIEQELRQRDSFDAIKFVLNDIELHPLQCIDIMKMLYQKRCIVIYDTGTGKTLLAAAMIKLLCNEDPTRKFVMFVKKDQLIQTPKKLTDACGKQVLASAADVKSLDQLLKDGLDSATVLMLTHDCLSNERIMNELFKYKTRFCGVLVDEAHELSNFIGSYSASVLQAVCNCFEYCVALTATPVTTDLRQLAHLAYIVDKSRYPNYNRLYKQLSSRRMDINEDPLFFINRKGDDFGGRREYHGILEWVEPMHHQKISAGGDRLMRLCKGDGAYNQVEKLVEVIKQYKGKRGLVYINQGEVLAWVKPFLDAAGIRYDCINGHTPGKNRAAIMNQFNVERSLDVVLTSVTTAIDLDCDFVIFYEFTVCIKQMIGRAHRGLGNKSLDVIFIITDDTNEVDYFVQNILSISFVIRDVLHKDYQEIEDVNASLEEHVC